MSLLCSLSQKHMYVFAACGLLISIGLYLIDIRIIHNSYAASTDESAQWLTPKKKINIQKAMDFPFTHILNRYKKDYGVSHETALEHERELKRFLIIAAENHPESLDMFSPEVDNLWHTFLLFTKEYHTFCYNLLGQFVHQHCRHMMDCFLPIC